LSPLPPSEPRSGPKRPSLVMWPGLGDVCISAVVFKGLCQQIRNSQLLGPAAADALEVAAGLRPPVSQGKAANELRDKIADSRVEANMDVGERAECAACCCRHFLDDAVARGDPEQLRPALEAAEQAAEARLNKAREALAFLEAVPEELARIEPMGDIMLLRDAIVTAEKAAGGSTAQTTASKQRLELLEDTLGTCGDKDITSIKAATEWASSQLAEAMSAGVDESECMRVRKALCLLRLKAVTAGAAEEPNDIEGAIRVCGFCGVEEKDMEEARACLVAVKRKDVKAAATFCRLAGLQEKDLVEAGRHLLFVKSIAK